MTCLQRDKEARMTDFNLFWEAYPRKEAKKRALIAFDRAVKDQDTLDRI